MDIWDIAASFNKQENEKSSSQSAEMSLLFIGNSKSGKTSFIYRFLNREENPRPTLALEYTFGRQSKANDVTKSVCHIWELGGGNLFLDLMTIPATLKTVQKLCAIVMIDLSTPDQLLVSLTAYLDVIRSSVDKCITQKPNLREKLAKKLWKKSSSDHQDKDSINPLLIPVVIIGGKYDIFQNFEPEQRKIICRSLRMVAHLNGATLLFFSSRIESLVNRTRALISHLAFDNVFAPSTCFDDNKPLFIPFGSDSIAQISGQRGWSLAMWTNAFYSQFPQVEHASLIPDDPAKDPKFKEPEIDDLRQQKDDELRSLKKRMAQIK
ncbi:Cytoplasmic dynein 2 light intermediate chain 1 [Chamberlinius hualienensis]